MTTVLTVAGSDPVAGAGVQADLKAIEAMGLHACTVITCVTAQNTVGVQSIFPVPPEEVEHQLDSVLADVDISAVKTGMLYDADIVGVVSDRLRRLKAPIVVDPVMRATAGGPLSSEGLIEKLRKNLLPSATIVTPNVHEAKALTGVEVGGIKNAKRAADSLIRDGAKAVLIKGGHMKGKDSIDHLFHQGGSATIVSPRVNAEVHGTGCVLSAVIAANLAAGADLENAVRKAKAVTYGAIVAREHIGRGFACANPMSTLRADASKADMLEELDEAAADLRLLLDARLLPEVGSNMGYAVVGALTPDDVAAFEGRIIRVGDRAETTGCGRFGVSKHVARIVLAASAKDSSVRCALNIKYSSDNVKACRDSGLNVASFDRSREPKGASSMTWGVTDAIERHGNVPDVIFDRGGVGKEPMIRLLGDTPSDVIGKLRRISVELDRR
ncbi:MAG: bifunctional hydroxymethylpyrimidine kinase/phosphomethylpyrimidine kinase [Methanobacteriota archaeon]|nr:MAG: bifunctional hydroxymethylpyrimidine kinase/phosphomethylpyrimidine kinase [Euryarchaeota archaeon]